MKWLSIDCMKEPVSFELAEGAGLKHSLQAIDWNEIPAYSIWLGRVGGRDLLDAFEVALINAGVLRVWPISDEGWPLTEDAQCVSMEHHDSGAWLWWEPRIKCTDCGGKGHFAMVGELVGEDDICLRCDGDGFTHGGWIKTDLDGLPVSSKGA